MGKVVGGVKGHRDVEENENGRAIMNVLLGRPSGLGKGEDCWR